MGNYPSYKPDECGKTPLRGVLIERREMPGQRTAFAYVVQLTLPCMAMTRDDKLVSCEIGDRVLLWETTQLEQELKKFTSDPDKLAEVMAQPQEKRKQANGNSFWVWRLAFVQAHARGKFAPALFKKTDEANADGAEFP